MAEWIKNITGLEAGDYQPYDWHTDLEDCWGLCGAKGGACNVEGCNGYCCSRSKVELNGDCPASAIQFLLDHDANHSSGHKCVEILGEKFSLSLTLYPKFQSFFKYQIRLNQLSILHQQPLQQQVQRQQ